jgi:hypothetical protein
MVGNQKVALLFFWSHEASGAFTILGVHNKKAEVN